ncbi:GTPase [Micromonospora yangpuensis]|uniref:50S ribosome-binding GTPase n=1 Tax=Micromonospora yangpuensis TaxID=683228 RepID=A0A1C6VGC4_9ACTN|nr:GTPase [Micromonospora yangpuensis]SCL65383.1 50S ribosome-binding GTPase [Micromonospora yangpuensis]
MTADRSRPPGPGPASALLGELCRRLAGRAELRGEATLADLAAQCAEPLRVAVVGDVSTGKSTLVNALVRRFVAAVDRPETTAGVTWYRHPALPVPPAIGPHHRHQPAAFPLADRIVLADSPGTNTASGADRFTEELVHTATETAGSVAALVYLTRGGLLSERARRQLRRYTSLTAGPLGGGGNVVAVVGKLDELAVAGPEEAEATLSEQTGLPPDRVVAVNQRLAMAVRLGAVTDRHLRVIAAVAADPVLSVLAAAGPEALLSGLPADGPDAETLAEIADLLQPLAVALPGLAGADHRKILERLDEASRVPVLERVLAELAADADVLTVCAVVGRLRRFAARLGPERGAVVWSGLAETTRAQPFRRIERREAALALESPPLRRSVEAAQRQAAAHLLASSGTSPDPEIAHRWSLIAARPGRPTVVRRVAEIVADAARAEPTGSRP